MPLKPLFTCAAIYLGVRYRRFAYVAFGTLYGYGGLSVRILDLINSGSPTVTLMYFVVTGTMMVIALVVLARRFGRDE